MVKGFKRVNDSGSEIIEWLVRHNLLPTLKGNLSSFEQTGLKWSLFTDPKRLKLNWFKLYSSHILMLAAEMFALVSYIVSMFLIREVFGESNETRVQSA